jgi:hypothetical protein
MNLPETSPQRRDLRIEISRAFAGAPTVVHLRRSDDTVVVETIAVLRTGERISLAIQDGVLSVSGRTFRL